jgi:hypothetical protein
MKHCLIKQHWNGTPRDKYHYQARQGGHRRETDTVPFSLSLNSSQPLFSFFSLEHMMIQETNEFILDVAIGSCNQVAMM